MLLGYGKSWLIDKDRKWLGASYQPALLDLFPLSLLSCSLIAQLVMNPPAIQENLVQFLSGEDPWIRDRLPTPVFLGFPCGSAGKESTCSVGDLGSIPGLGRSPEEGKGYPLQYSGLENSWVAKRHD